MHWQAKRKMDKWGLRTTLKVLNEVKVQFSETKEIIEAQLEQECLKENISVEEGGFLFTSLEAKNSHRKTVFIL